MRSKTLGTAAIALLGMSGAALAQGGLATIGPYVGAGVGQSDFDISDGDWGLGIDSRDDTDTAWRLFAGVRPHPVFGAEVGYIDFGETSGSGGASAEATGVDLVALGVLPLLQGQHQLDAFGKLGGYWWETDLSRAGIGSDLDDRDDFDYTFGAGLQYHFGPVGVRAEWQRYNDLFGSIDTDVMMGSVLFSF